MKAPYWFYLLFILGFATACNATPQMPPQSQMPQAQAPQSPQSNLPPGTQPQAPPQGVAPNQGGYPSNQMGPGMMYGNQGPYNQNPVQNFKSNGERIYFTGQDNSGAYIRANSIDMPMSSMTSGCYGCHGPEAKGGTIRFMMGTINVPDIRYKTLSEKDPDMEHAPYTVQTLRRAITQGVDPGGNPLKPPMPQWQMSPEDLDDTVSYLKSLP